MINNSYPSKIYADEHDTGVVPINEKHHGYSYGEWSAKWWQWALSIPADRTPMEDRTGERCATNQSGPVWFLAGEWGSPVSRICTVPANVSIFFPIYNGECSTAEKPDKKSYEELRNCVKEDNICANCYFQVLEARIDGKLLVNLDNFENYRVETPLFYATFPPNALFGATPGVSAVVAEGWFIMLEPLSKGNHILNFKYILNDPAELKGSQTDVTYYLIVQ
jgi:hypothetical protein